MDRSRLRQIIKEELSRAMNEGFRGRTQYRPAYNPGPRMPGPEEEALVSYEVSIDPSLKDLSDIEAAAVPLAIARAEDQFPGRKWQIMKGNVKGTNYGVGMMFTRAPDAIDPRNRVRVYLLGSPVAEEEEEEDEYFDPDVGGYDPDDLYSLPVGELQRYHAGERVRRRG